MSVIGFNFIWLVGYLVDYYITIYPSINEIATLSLAMTVLTLVASYDRSVGISTLLCHSDRAFSATRNLHPALSFRQSLFGDEESPLCLVIVSGSLTI